MRGNRCLGAAWDDDNSGMIVGAGGWWIGLHPVCCNRASRTFIKSPESINPARRADEHFTQVAMLARKIRPCGDIVCGLMMIDSPLFFCPLNLQLVIVASVALCDDASANKGWSDKNAKDRSATCRCQRDF